MEHSALILSPYDDLVTQAPSLLRQRHSQLLMCSLSQQRAQCCTDRVDFVPSAQPHAALTILATFQPALHVLCSLWSLLQFVDYSPNLYIDHIYYLQFIFLETHLKTSSPGYIVGLCFMQVRLFTINGMLFHVFLQ